VEGATPLDARARTIFQYFKNYNYEVAGTGEVIKFVGNYRASKGQAAALILYTFLGAHCPQGMCSDMAHALPQRISSVSHAVIVGPNLDPLQVDSRVESERTCCVINFGIMLGQDARFHTVAHCQNRPSGLATTLEVCDHRRHCALVLAQGWPARRWCSASRRPSAATCGTD